MGCTDLYACSTGAFLALSLKLLGMLHPASQYIDDGVLNEGTEDKDQTGGHPDIYSFGEGHRGHRPP